MVLNNDPQGTRNTEGSTRRCIDQWNLKGLIYEVGDDSS
jgi:hypothetical protein